VAFLFLEARAGLDENPVRLIGRKADQHGEAAPKG
jgi:hypothetical protein